MAESAGSIYFSSLSLEILCDQEIALEIEKDFNIDDYQVTEADSNICEQCNKSFKTKGGLTRHKKRMHQLKDVLTSSEIAAALEECRLSLSNDELFPSQIRQNFSYVTYTVKESLYQDVGKIFKKLLKSGNPDVFYQNCYETVIQNSKNYIAGIDEVSSTLLLKKLIDRIFGKYHRKSTEDKIEVKGITEKEIPALEYLSGYVIYKLKSKFKNSRWYFKDQNKASVAILENFVATSDARQELIELMNRGGLTPTTKSCVDIFYKVECHFREATSKKNIRKIDTKLLTQEIVSSPEITSIFFTSLQDYEFNGNTEIADNVLNLMVQLYLRVRTFSFARDLTEKENIKRNTKSLRKNLKKSKDKKDGKQKTI